MLKNYLKTAFRNLLRQKSSTFINVAGLTLGITSSLVLFLLVRHLSSFDNFHFNRDRIYRIVTQSDGNDGKFYSSGVQSVFPEAFRQDFPEAEEVTFTSYEHDVLITIPQKQDVAKKYTEDGIVFAQPNFFKIFDRKILTGNSVKGLDDPNEAIVSVSLAKKYFGREDAVGEVIGYDTMEYRITAVMEDAPTNTDLPFNIMLSLASIKAAKEKQGWNSIRSDEHCYILLKKGERIDNVEARIPAFVDKYLGKDNYEHQSYVFQPLREMHYDNRFETYSYHTVSRETLIALGSIAIFLIITACINFINLSTAEAIKRSKEVGIRKSLGSSRTQLMGQFLGETAMVTIFSMVMSLGLAQLALSLLNPFLKLRLGLNFSSDTLLWVFIIGITVIVALLSGLYPSFIISGYKPALALKNQINNKSSSGYVLRKGLVVMQFVISQFFIIGTIVLVSQMNYFAKKELGFRKDAVMLLPIPVQEKPVFGDGSSKMRTLRDELMRVEGIEDASLSSTPPSSNSVRSTDFYLDGQDESERKGTQVKQVDGNYIGLYGLRLVAGENLPDYDTATGLIVNEKLVRIAGFQDPRDIIGKRLRMWGAKLPVIGVVKDFHTVSLHEPIAPTVMMTRIQGFRTLSLKVNPAHMQEAIAQAKKAWEAAYPEHLFEYEFLDEHIREFYENEQQMSVLVSVFTSLAIFIGCLGLFGLATFMTNQKTKEIGVRKVLGASVESIIFLFSREYAKLILIGFIIAAPLSWVVMNQWLADFAYKITIGPIVFLVGLGVTLTIAIFTVGYKSLKAAIRNPIKSLRYE